MAMDSRAMSRAPSFVPTRQSTSVVGIPQPGIGSRMNSTMFPHGGAAPQAGPGGPSSAQTPPPGGNGNYQNLFVSGLPQFVTDEILQKVFSEAGSIKSAKVMLDTTTGASRGFGFVLFESQQEGCKAYGTLHNQMAKLDDGREFRIHAAPSQHDGKAAALECSVIYARNIPATVSEERIQAYFATFGTVIGCSIRNDSSNQDYRLATVEFKTIPEAKDAIHRTHNNKEIFPESGDRPVLAKFADSSQVKLERSQKKEQQWQHRWGSSAPPVPPPFNVLGGTPTGLGASAGAMGASPFSPPPQLPFLVGSTPPNVAPPPPPLPQVKIVAPPSEINPALGSSGFGALQPQLGGSVMSNPQLGSSAPQAGLTSPSAGNGAGALESTRQQLPDYVPLPLEPRPGFQQVLFQGVLGLAPDGRLYPVRVDQCSYVPMAPGGAPVFAPPSTLGTTPPLAASPNPNTAPLGSSYTLAGSVHGPVGSSVHPVQTTQVVDSGPTQHDMEQILTDLNTQGQQGADVET